MKKPLCLALALAAACAHPQQAGPKAEAAAAAKTGSVQVEDAIHGVRYLLPPGEDGWQVNREGEARSASSSFPLAKPAAPADCREHARTRLTSRKEPSAANATAAEAPREQATGDSPTATWSFTSGTPSAPMRNRWAFFARGADCLVLHVSGVPADKFAGETFDAGAKTFQVLQLSADRQREVDLLAGMGFLERRDPGAALDRFEALSQREPDLSKAHFGALMAGFELGAQAYGRALPHGMIALKAERELTPEQRQLALRAVGVMQLAQNQVKDAATTLSELVVRAPDLAEGQYNYACALARLGDTQGALDHLKAAVKLDGDLAQNAKEDEDLKVLRGSPLFEQLLKTSPAAGK